MQVLEGFERVRGLNAAVCSSPCSPKSNIGKGSWGSPVTIYWQGNFILFSGCLAPDQQLLCVSHMLIRTRTRTYTLKWHRTRHFWATFKLWVCLTLFYFSPALLFTIYNQNNNNIVAIIIVVVVVVVVFSTSINKEMLNRNSTFY